MPRELQPCGTYAAHRRHVRNGEEPCEVCKAVYNARKRDERRRREARDRGSVATWVVIVAVWSVFLAGMLAQAWVSRAHLGLDGYVLLVLIAFVAAGAAVYLGCEIDGGSDR